MKRIAVERVEIEMNGSGNIEMNGSGKREGAGISGTGIGGARLRRGRKAMFLVLSFCLCLVSCAGKSRDSKTEEKAQKTPKDAAVCAMEAFKTVDTETFNACTDNYLGTEKNWLGIPTVRRYKVFNELLQPGSQKSERFRKKYEADRAAAERIAENLTWEIGEVVETGEQARISMVITNTDLSDVMGNYVTDILEEVLDDSTKGLSRMLLDLSEMDYDMSRVLPYLEEASGTRTASVTVTAYKEGGKWKIHLSDSLLDAMMGDFKAGNFSEKVEKRIDELEEQYDKKMEQWGEEFGERIEKGVERLFE